MVKPEKFNHLHLFYHFTITLNVGNSPAFKAPEPLTLLSLHHYTASSISLLFLFVYIIFLQFLYYFYLQGRQVLAKCKLNFGFILYIS